MRKLFISLCCFALPGITFSQKDECESKQHPMPVISDSSRRVLEANLRSAEKKYRNDSTNDEYIIWYGRRTAYLGHYGQAIEIFSKGIRLHPSNARFYRHRGHRYISLRCFDKAIADLKKATELIQGQIDEIEADGMPNALNIPTSTLHTNIYYHLGLAYYLKGDYRQALLAYEKCFDISDNDDMRIATLNWLHITLRKMGRNKEAEQRIKEAMSDEMEIIENREYLDIINMYQNNDAGKLEDKTGNQETLANATLGFALGNYYLLKGKKDKARELFEKVVAGNQWSSFGYIAAEAELAKMK